METFQFLGIPLFGFFALLCTYYLVLRKPSSTKIREPPRPAGAWPIIGHLHLLARGDLPHVTLGKMADKYGPVFKLKLGVRQAIVVSDWEVAKECYTTNDRALANRPSGLGAKIMGYNYALIGSAPYGPYWRDLRKIITLEVLSSRRLESLKHVWDSEISTSVKELYQIWADQNKAQGQVSVEMKQWFSDMTLNVAVRLAVGKKYSGATADCEKNKAVQCQKAIRNFFRLAGLFVAADYLPFLGWLDLGGHEKEMKHTAKELDYIAQEWLDDHKKKRTSNRTVDEPQDFMDVMLSILEESTFTGYDVDIINKSTCFALILGGTDTVAVTLTWALCLLLNNPHVLKKAQDELDIHVGKDRHVNESDIKNLVYLQAMIKETLRLYPAGPLLGPRQVIEDCTIAGYHVRAGTRVIVNAWKFQRDPSIWSNPCEFQPERFLDKDIDVKGQHFELIPFGAGRRACPGISFALQVLPLALARLLHGFELKNPSESQVDMTETPGMVHAKTTPLEVLITPRLSPKFYV